LGLKLQAAEGAARLRRLRKRLKDIEAWHVKATGP